MWSLHIFIYNWMPIVDNLLKRGWAGNNGCVMCGTDLQTVDHLLVGCVVSKVLFISILDESYVYPSSEDVNFVWEELPGRGSRTDTLKPQIFLAALQQTIWCERNNISFRNLPTNVICITHRIRVLAKEWADFCMVG